MQLLLGAGIASFVRFNDRQTLLSAGKELQTYLRSAQTKARVGDRPSSCDKLLAYAVVAGQGTNQVQLRALCDNSGGAGVVTPITYATYQFPSSILFESAVNMQFGVLLGGVTNPGTITLESTTTTQTYAITVTQGGEISDGVFSP
jgi:hypothetical protein